MYLSSKNNEPYIAIILILAIIFFAIMVAFGAIMLKGLRSNAWNSPASSEPNPNNIITPQEAKPSDKPNTAVESEQHTTDESASSATLDAKTEEAMNLIEEQVSQIRLLSVKDAIPRKVLSPDELRAYVEEELLEDLEDEDAQEDVRRFALLGLFPPDLEMRQLLEDLYSEQIAGFYKIEEREMVVVAGGDFGISERLTYAHEYVHALQYANYDFENDLGYSEEACETDSERCAAIQALIEGDANFTQLKWFETHATHKDILEFLTNVESYESPVLDSAPPYLSASLMFPYNVGTTFVEHLFDMGGYDAIHQAYTTTPPVSTEQVMFPERYPDDIPLEINLPDLSLSLGSGWDIDQEGVVGAWDIYMMLSQGYEERFQIDAEEALFAAEGWGGDSYAFLSHENDDERLFVMKTVWDSEKDSLEAWEAFSKWLDLRFGTADGIGIYSNEEVFARVFKTGNNGFILIISEGLESLNRVYDFLNE